MVAINLIDAQAAVKVFQGKCLNEIYKKKAAFIDILLDWML